VSSAVRPIIHAFHPKAQRSLIWQVFWLARCTETFPSASGGQWYIFSICQL